MKKSLKIAKILNLDFLLDCFVVSLRATPRNDSFNKNFSPFVIARSERSERRGNPNQKNHLLNITKIIGILFSMYQNIYFSVCYAATPENTVRGHILILKFFSSMFGVLISALAIWGCLKLYKKIALKSNSKLDNLDYDKNLESPKDFREAINLFLNKTDK